MFQIGRSDSDISSFSKPSEFEVEDLAEPDLRTFVEKTQLGWVVVKFEELDHFHLNVKIEVTAVLVLAANFRDLWKRGYVVSRKH